MTTTPSPSVADPSRQIWMDRLIVLLIASFILLPFLGSFGLWDPWETHYGEVGRQLTERNDWISSWWGSHWENGQGAKEGRHFFSKPIFLMWLMAMGLEVFGFSEWGIRLGVAFIAIGAVVMAFSMGERVWNRAVGFTMAGVLLTTPFFAFLSRQAQTDMPFVGNMTIGLCFFIMATFGRDRLRKVKPWEMWAMLGFLLLVSVPQIVLITRGLMKMRTAQYGLSAYILWGPSLAAIYSALLLAVVLTTWRRAATVTQRQLHYYGFYIFIALATLSKGLLGFLLPGAFIFFTLALTGEWRRIKEMELPRGIAIFIACGFPWYVAMLVIHGYPYFDRFFIHDHFKRLATGVHQIDSGSFEHYVKWLGFGLWPWIGFLPAALLRLFMGHHLGMRDDRQKATLMLTLWAVFTFTLFTLSSTKFHHYIFPAVPACAFLIALTLHDLLSTGRARRIAWILSFTIVGFIALIGWDIIADPQHLKNLFTYKYDRKWDSDWNAGFQLKLSALTVLATLGAVTLAARARRARQAGVAMIATAATLMTVFCLWDYMPTISSTWSQKGVWDLYYERCSPTEGPPGHDSKKRYCVERALTYKLNWRGETYYTQNLVIPIRKDEEFKYFLEQNKGRPFYAIMEKTRYATFKSRLSAEFKGKSCELETHNIKFALIEVPCKPDGGARRAAPEPP